METLEELGLRTKMQTAATIGKTKKPVTQVNLVKSANPNAKPPNNARSKQGERTYL
jgi:hypothetical protein